MQPEKQLEQLQAMIETLNKGNATKAEMVELFEVASNAITTIRESLEGSFKGLEGNVSKQYDRLIDAVNALEDRIDEGVRNVDSSSKEGLNTLKREIKAELEAVIGRIPELPDFQSLLREVEAKIPAPIKPEKSKKIVAGRNISVETDKDTVEITNTNPKITVSRFSPFNPQEGDLWIKAI